MDKQKREYLESLGVDVSVTLDRLMNKEDLYFKLLEDLLEETYIEDIEKGLQEADYELAFRSSHSLKGVSGSLGLNKLYERVYHLTDALRFRPANKMEIAIHMAAVKDIYEENIEVIKKVIE